MKRKSDLAFPAAADAVETPLPSSAVSRRALLGVLPALGASGCIGSFALTNKLLDWNRGIGNKWVNWLVFALFFIIPIYPIVFGLIDLWVINSIEFWTGNTPLASKATPDGGELVTERTSDPKTARLTHKNAEGEVLAELYIRRESDEHFEMLDREGNVLASVSGRDSVTLRNAKGRKVARLKSAQLRNVQRAVEQGASPAEHTWGMLEDNGEDQQLLALGDTVRSGVLI
jgi:hypothetical protein